MPPPPIKKKGIHTLDSLPSTPAPVSPSRHGVTPIFLAHSQPAWQKTKGHRLGSQPSSPRKGVIPTVQTLNSSPNEQTIPSAGSVQREQPSLLKGAAPHKTATPYCIKIILRIIALATLIILSSLVATSRVTLASSSLIGALMPPTLLLFATYLCQKEKKPSICIFHIAYAIILTTGIITLATGVLSIKNSAFFFILTPSLIHIIAASVGIAQKRPFTTKSTEALKCI